MRNDYTGETLLEIDGEQLTLLINFRALAALRSEFGQADLAVLLRDGDPEVLSRMAAIGLAKRHPGWSADRIMDLDVSPGVVPLSEALTAALNITYLGPTLAARVAKQNPPKRIVQKMTSAIRWFWPFKSRTAAA